MAETNVTVRMAATITGTRDGAEWPPIGGTLDVPAAEADRLIAAGHAVVDSSVNAPRAAVKKSAARKAVKKTAKPEE